IRSRLPAPAMGSASPLTAPSLLVPPPPPPPTPPPSTVLDPPPPVVPPRPPLAPPVPAQTQAANVPFIMQTCAPLLPFGHAHIWLAPGTHLLAPDPLEQAPTKMTRITAARFMARPPRRWVRCPSFNTRERKTSSLFRGLPVARRV